jgi:hypothetical protein
MRNTQFWMSLPTIMAVVAAFDTLVVHAQPPKSRIDWVFPAGVQSGKSVVTTLTGGDLEGLSRLIFSDTRIAAQATPDGKWTITAAADVPAGMYELRGVGAWGVSNPVPFVVGPLEETTEVEPNDQKPQPLKWPLTVNGQIQSASDVDRYLVPGKKGQRLVISLKADAFDSPLDGALKMFGPTGKFVAESQDSFDYDPALELELPDDGDYRVEVSDAVYSGSPAHRYRLSVHAGPTVDSFQPAVFEPGKTTSYRIYGRGLGDGAQPAAEFLAIRSIPEQVLSVSLGNDALSTGTGRLGAYSYSIDPFPRWLQSVNGQSLVEPIPFSPAEGSVQIEAEPNDKPQNPQTITIPADFSGVISRPGDIDWIAFDAEKDESLHLELFAQRQRSLVQSHLSLQRMLPDGKTAEIASSFDSLENPLGPQFEKATRDPRLTFKTPEKSKYFLRIAHVNASEGDARYSYRLVIRRAKPDYRIVAMATENGPAGTVCFRGGRCVISVNLDRYDGFDGSVRVEAKDLPAGITAWPVVFGPGIRKREMVLEAAADAPIVEFPLKLKGSTHWADSKASVDWVPGQKPDTEFASTLAASGGYLVRPLIGPQNQERGVSRYSSEFWMAIRETPIPFRIAPRPLRLFAKRGETVDLPVDVLRQNGFAAPVSVSLANLPPQLDAVTAEVANDKSDIVLKLKIGPNVPIGRHTIYLNGVAPFGFAKDPAAKEKPNITWNQPSRPVTLIVSP